MRRDGAGSGALGEVGRSAALVGARSERTDRAHRPGHTWRRRAVLVGLGALGLAVYLATALNRGSIPRGESLLRLPGGRSVLVPSPALLPPLRRRIVEIAESQIGYTTDPANTYCNKFSAYWYSGNDDCGNDDLDEEWCADFAAWVWQKAGAEVDYAYVSGDLNSSSESFYEWGERLGTWHPLGSGYRPEPGDVAIYGLDPSVPVATHVAIVIGDPPGARGPIAVNGDGDLTGFSVVEVQSDEYEAVANSTSAPLSGYVSPSPPT